MSQLCVSPFLGRYLDRYPLYPAVVFSLVVRIVGSIFYSAAATPLQVILSRLLQGVGNLMIIS